MACWCYGRGGLYPKWWNIFEIGGIGIETSFCSQVAS
jgi:hypothetical protein